MKHILTCTLPDGMYEDFETVRQRGYPQETQDTLLGLIITFWLLYQNEYGWLREQPEEENDNL